MRYCNRQGAARRVCGIVGALIGERIHAKTFGFQHSGSGRSPDNEALNRTASWRLVAGYGNRGAPSIVGRPNNRTHKTLMALVVWYSALQFRCSHVSGTIHHRCIYRVNAGRNIARSNRTQLYAPRAGARAANHNVHWTRRWIITRYTHSERRYAAMVV